MAAYWRHHALKIWHRRRRNTKNRRGGYASSGGSSGGFITVLRDGGNIGEANAYRHRKSWRGAVSASAAARRRFIRQKRLAAQHRCVSLICSSVAMAWQRMTAGSSRGWQQRGVAGGVIIGAAD